jgi:hypothetical protein
MLGRFAGYGENVMTNKNVKQILYDMFERHFWFKRYGLKGQGLNPNTGKQFETEAIARDVCRKVTTCPLDLAVNIPLSMKNQNPDSWFALQNSDKVRQEISALGWETGFGRKAVPTNMNTTEALARGLKKINQMPKLVLNVETGLKNFDNEAEENAKQNDDFLEVADIEGEDEGEGGGEGGGEGEGDDGMGDEEGGRGEKGSEVEHAAFLEATARTRTRKRIRGGKGGGASMGGGVGGAIKALPPGKCHDRESWEVEIMLLRDRQNMVDQKKRCYSCFIRQFQYNMAAAELQNLLNRPEIVQMKMDDPFPDNNDTEYTKLMAAELGTYVNDTTACPIGLYPGFDQVLLYKWRRFEPLLANKYKRIPQAKKKKKKKKKKKEQCMDLKVKYKAALREPVVTQEECEIGLREIEMELTRRAYEISKAMDRPLRIDEPYAAKYKAYSEARFAAVAIDGETITSEVNNAAILAGYNVGGKSMCTDLMMCSASAEANFGQYWNDYYWLNGHLPFETENLDIEKITAALEMGGSPANPPGWSRRIPGVDVLPPRPLAEILGGNGDGDKGDIGHDEMGIKAGNGVDSGGGLRFQSQVKNKAKSKAKDTSTSDLVARANSLIKDRRAGAHRSTRALDIAEGAWRNAPRELKSDLEADGWSVPSEPGWKGEHTL